MHVWPFQDGEHLHRLREYEHLAHTGWRGPAPPRCNRPRVTWHALPRLASGGCIRSHRVGGRTLHPERFHFSRSFIITLSLPQCDVSDAVTKLSWPTSSPPTCASPIAPPQPSVGGLHLSHQRSIVAEGYLCHFHVANILPLGGSFPVGLHPGCETSVRRTSPCGHKPPSPYPGGSRFWRAVSCTETVGSMGNCHILVRCVFRRGRSATGPQQDWICGSTTFVFPQSHSHKPDLRIVIARSRVPGMCAGILRQREDAAASQGTCRARRYARSWISLISHSTTTSFFPAWQTFAARGRFTLKLGWVAGFVCTCVQSLSIHLSLYMQHLGACRRRLP